MDLIMGCSALLMLLGMIVVLAGMCWSAIDGRLWNNPGDSVMKVGALIAGVGVFAFLVGLFFLGVQCTFTTTCQL